MINLNRAHKSQVYFVWCYEIRGIFALLGTEKVQPCFQIYVKSVSDFSLLQINIV